MINDSSLKNLNMNSRLIEIDRAIGISISLVVIGHMSFLRDARIEWYSNLWFFYL